MKKIKRPKIARSVKQLSNFADTGLFLRGHVKEKIPARILIKNAQKLATGIKTKKEAIEALQTFHDFATQHGKVKLVWPRKNKKLYATELGISKRFKVYPMPVYHDTDEYIPTTQEGKTVLKMKGKFVEIELFQFPNKKALVKNPVLEVNKIVDKVERKYGTERRKEYKFKCGEYYSLMAMEDKEFLEEEITRYFREYSGVESGRRKSDWTEKWLKGVQVATFNSQENLPPRHKRSQKRKPKQPRKRKPKKKKRLIK